MTRKEYIKKQKEKGRHIFGVFPAQYPKEILWAMNVLPVEIWDPPLDISGANAHLQPYICSVVKLGLELILQDKCDDLDGFLFPHTCDSIQNMTSIVYDYMGLDKPCYFFYHPKAPYRPSSRIYYVEQLKNLVARLEKQLSPLDPSELKRSVKQGRELARLFRELYLKRAEGKLPASNAAFYQIIRQGEFLHPDDFIPILKELLAKAEDRADGKPALILSGILPNPPEILTLLDDLGILVGEDDLICCGRRLPVPSSQAEDPYEALAESYFAMPPCTTKDFPIQERQEGLLQKIEQSKAKGVIFYMVKFCEPELFDAPSLMEELKKRDIATLFIDTEVHQGLSGQLHTRVEAFIEMIS